LSPFSDDPVQLAIQGKIANVPVIYGTNADEGTIFNRCPTDLPASQYEKYLNLTYGPELGSEVSEMYPTSDYRSAYWATSRALGDSQVSALCSSARVVHDVELVCP
jgi:carboxylesterase type B